MLCAMIVGGYNLDVIEVFLPPPSLLPLRISEYISPRPPLPRQLEGAERAVLDFHTQTANISNILLEQFRQVYHTTQLPNCYKLACGT